MIACLVALVLFLQQAYPNPRTTNHLEEKQWLLSIDVGLGLGFMDHTLDNGVEEDWFDLDTLRAAHEQDGAGYRLGFGRRISEDVSLLVYGGGSYLFPGILLDNHGPFIPPELTYLLKEIALGLEVKFDFIRMGVGCSFYSGTVSLWPDDREEAKRGEDWKGNLADGIGPHLIFGFTSPTEKDFTAAIDLIWRDIPLDFPTTPTGIDPEEFSRSMIEIRTSLHVTANLF